jgi:hypothetical protein
MDKKLKKHHHCMFVIKSADNGFFVGGKNSDQYGNEPDFMSVFPTFAGVMKFVEGQIKKSFEIEKEVKKSKKIKAKK